MELDSSAIWRDGSSHLDFVKDLSTAKRLVIEKNFVTRFGALDDESARLVQHAVSQSAVVVLSIWHTVEMPDSAGCFRFLQLEDMIRSIPSLEVADINYFRGGDLVAHFCLFQCLRQVKELFMHCIFTPSAASVPSDPLMDHALARGLRGHPLLRTLGITPSPSVNSLLLQVIPTIPTLKALILDCQSDPDVSAEAALSLLPMKAPELTVTFNKSNFWPIVPHQMLCQAITKAEVKGVEMEPLRISETICDEFAEALKSSLLSMFGMYWSLDDVKVERIKDLMESLAVALPSMINLQDLRCCQCQGAYDVNSEPMAIAVLHAAGKCPNLKSLYLGGGRFVYTKNTDKAFGACVDASASLEEITIDTKRIFEAPMLVDALWRSTTVQQIIFPRLSAGENPTYKRQIDSIYLARALLTKEPVTRMEGFRLLEFINDMVGCLFYRLRKNPTLCYREPCDKISRRTTTVTGKRKCVEDKAAI